MGKIKNCFVAILLVFIVTGVFGQSDLREKVKQTYNKEIGVRELTGHNDGSRVETYLHTAGLGKGYAWCGAFVNWVFAVNGVRTVKAPAWAPAWFPNKNLIYHQGKKIREPPDSGDVFGIYFQSKKRIAHVGFIDKWGDKWVTTVEGNTNEAGSRDGDGVYRKRRIKRQIYKVSNFIGNEKHSNLNLDNTDNNSHDELRDRTKVSTEVSTSGENDYQGYCICAGRDKIQGYNNFCACSCRYCFPYRRGKQTEE